MRGDPDAIATEIRAWAAIGVSHLALHFGTTDPDELVAHVERFDREVETLTWAARGKTSAEIAEILGVTEATIDSTGGVLAVAQGIRTRCAMSGRSP